MQLVCSSDFSWSCKMQMFLTGLHVTYIYYISSLYDQCLLELQNEAVFMWTTELENMATLCFKALEGSNYGVRVAVAKLLGTVMATALMPKQAAGRL